MVKKNIICKYLILIIALALIVSMIVVFFGTKKEINYSNFHNVGIIEDGKNYNIKIEYPKFNSKKINEKIEKLVNNELKSFKEKCNKLKKTTDFNYELNIQYEITSTDRLYSIHFITYKYLEGAHYERTDSIYYYDYIDNDLINWDNLFKNKKEALEELSILSTAGLKQKYKEYIYSDKTMFEEGVSPIKKNYKYIMFSDNHIEIFFPPYQVAPWSSGDLSLKIGYGDINDILIDKYKGIEEPEKKEPITSYKRKTRDINELKNKKLIALTFDDGPSWKTTRRLLDGLRERDVRVTFFVLGNRVKQMPEIVKKAYDDGHTIGSHTYSHKSFNNLKDEEIKKEVSRTNEEIEKAIGKKTNILRPPYGEYKKSMIKLTGMTFILWSVDPQDWKYKNVEKVYNHIIDNAKDGSIILLHDLYDTSVDAALMAIDKLLEEGYVFVSIEELEKLGKLNLSSGKYYYKIK